MDIAGTFNDFYSLMTGKKGTGLGALLEKHRENPLFFLLISNLQTAAGIPFLDAMQEAYRLYKEFAPESAGMEVDMGRLYDRAMAYGQKWDSLWCRQLAVALVALLDPSGWKQGTGAKAQPAEKRKRMGMLKRNRMACMGRRLLLKEKSLEECCRYVNGQAKKKADRQKADSLCETDGTVYGWVAAYYQADSIDAGDLFPASQPGNAGACGTAGKPASMAGKKEKKKQGAKKGRKTVGKNRADGAPANERVADVPQEQEGQLSLADFGAM